MDEFDQDWTELGIEDFDEEVGKRMDEDLDYAFALMLQSEEEEVATSQEKQVKTSLPNKENKTPQSVVDPQWEVIDPNPNLHSLFLEFNAQFFWGVLEMVEVRWSPRMTLCAGVCSYEGRGGLCSIRLSQPLLKFRPRKDMVETLLHEMIHAYLFVTQNNKDRDGHGPEFLKHMNRINSQTGARISVYHSFHDEVDHQRQHWWKCNGPCQTRKPYFGIVKRAMNRAPSPRDLWWSEHQLRCGGTFTKIKEPENFGQKKPSQQKAHNGLSDKSNTRDITPFLTPGTSKGANVSKKPNSSDTGHLNDVKTFGSFSGQSHSQDSVKKIVENPPTTSRNPSIVPFSGKGHVLGSGPPRINSMFKTPRKIPSSVKANKTLSVFTNKGLGFGAESLLSGTSSGVKSKISAVQSQVSSRQDSEPQSKAIEKSPIRQTTISECFKKSPARKKKRAIVFSSDSEDEIVMPQKKKGNTNVEASSKTSLNDQISEIVSCPSCDKRVNVIEINRHLDICLST